MPAHVDVGLGYQGLVCAECNVTWPCHDAVLERCDRNLADDLPCSCGWHEDDEKVVEDPEQEKVPCDG